MRKNVSRAAGLYFTRMEELWVTNGVDSFDQPDLDAITRTNDQGKLYEACYSHLNLEMMRGGARSATTNQQDNNIKLDAFGNTFS